MSKVLAAPVDQKEVTKDSMASYIHTDLKEKDIDISTSDIKQVLTIFEDELMRVIATERKYKLGKIGYLSGVQKIPERASGCFAINIPKGFTKWKRGYPLMTWSKAALDCDSQEPEEFFELPEHRLTSQARLFRQINHLPEIPEYAALPEEEIVKVCEKADEVEMKATRGSSTNQRKLLSRRKWNKHRSEFQKEFWDKEGYKPMGAPVEVYGEDLAQRDQLDTMWNQVKDKGDTVPEKHLIVKNVIAYGEYLGIDMSKHQDILDEEKRLKEIILNDPDMEEMEMKYQDVRNDKAQLKDALNNGNIHPYVFLMNVIFGEERFKQREWQDVFTTNERIAAWYNQQYAPNDPNAPLSSRALSQEIDDIR